jgi:hypothetical protein
MHKFYMYQEALFVKRTRREEQILFMLTTAYIFIRHDMSSYRRIL